MWNNGNDYGSLWIILIIILLFAWSGSGCNNCGCNNCGCGCNACGCNCGCNNCG